MPSSMTDPRVVLDHSRSLALVIHSGSIRAASASPHARARSASPSSLAQGPRIEVVPRLRARNSSAICAHGEEVRQMPDDPDRSDEPRGSERAVLTLEQRQREAAPAHLLAKRAQAGDQGDGNDADRRQAAVAAEVAHAGRVAGYRRDAKSNTEEGNGAQRRHPPAPGHPSSGWPSAEVAYARATVDERRDASAARAGPKSAGR